MDSLSRVALRFAFVTYQLFFSSLRCVSFRVRFALDFLRFVSDPFYQLQFQFDSIRVGFFALRFRFNALRLFFFVHFVALGFVAGSFRFAFVASRLCVRCTAFRIRCGA